ncbi:MAG: hypothetical protein JWQ04_2103 [Pedosphaera sp.]|nr:hypothetical protein [Pedosphaera sp.]
MNQSALNQKKCSIALLDSTCRELTVVFVHEFRRSPIAADLHPAAYLHYSPTQAQREADYKSVVQLGRSATHLQQLRNILEISAKTTRDLRPKYEEQKEHYRDAYVKWVISAMAPIDLIVCFPSDRSEAAFYHEAVANAVRVNNSYAHDLTPYFTKERDFKAGKQGVTLEEACQRIQCSFKGSLASVRNVLLIDDTWAGATTARAIVSHLSSKGLPADAKMTVLAPLIIFQEESQSRSGL